jgi:hypothetical protein
VADQACAEGNVRSREPWREPDRFGIPAAVITVRPSMRLDL